MRNVQKDTLKKAIAIAIAFGYRRGCKDTEGGTQSDADEKAEQALAEFLVSSAS